MDHIKTSDRISFTWTAELDEAGIWNGTCDELGISCWGHTVEEVALNIAEAVTTLFEAMHRKGELEQHLRRTVALKEALKETKQLSPDEETEAPPSPANDCPLCNEGPRGTAICNARRGRFAMVLMLDSSWMRDDADRPRCVNCLQVVPEERALGFMEGKLGGHIEHAPIITGYETVCCKVQPEPSQEPQLPEG